MSVAAGLLLRGRYELQDRVGVGAQGEVWKAHDRQHDRAVALKSRLAAEPDAASVLAEARVLLDLTPHAALPTVRDDFFEHDRYWIVMEWVAGESLRGTALGIDGALEHLARVASALDHLHSHEPPVIHRDVKPANVVVGAQGAVLVDFGLARNEVARAGSPAFLAPEVIAGEPATAASDLYALAVTAHVLLTGVYPEAGVPPPIPSATDADRRRMIAALGTALSIDPRQRPASCKAFVQALSPQDVPSNLPAPVATFVGRVDELAQAAETLDGARLLTVVGVGGVGKTALALESVRRRVDRHPGGVWFVDLASMRDDGVPGGVRAAMAIEPSSLDATSDIVAAVGRDTVLLVLDTCEGVIGAAATFVDAFLAGCPNGAVVATSREALRVPGERVLSAEPLAERDAARLLVDRIVQAGVSEAIDPGDDAVLAVIAAVDAIPLALELAALRVPQLGLDGVRQGLEARLDLLSAGARTRPRHETMRAAIDWSWQLLSSQAQACLRRVAVFAGGFDLPGASAVAGDAADALDELVARSMVWCAEGRYRMPDVVREFALDALEDAREAEEVVGRHQEWCLDVVHQIERGRADRERRTQAMALADREHDNIVAAAEAGGPIGLDVAQLMWATWREQGRHREARRLIATAVESAGDLSLVDRVSALQKLGDLCGEMGDLDEAELWLRQAEQGLDAETPPRRAAAVLNSLGNVAGRRADYDQALAYFERGLQIDGLEPAMQGNLRRNVAIAASRAGQLEVAVAALTEDLAISEDRGDVPGLINGLASLGAIEITRGDYAGAEPLIRRALEVSLGNDVLSNIGLLLANLVLVWHVKAPRAAALAFGAASAELRRTGQSAGPDQASYEAVQGVVRSALGDAFDDVVAEGDAMSASDVLELGPQL